MQVYISATLMSFFGRNHNLEIEADTVRGILDRLTSDYPDSEKILFDEDGKLRSFIKIYSGDEDITSSDRWNEKLPESAELLLLPAIAGGAPEESIIPEERRKETELDDVEIERFGKHLLLRDIGVKGQKRIKAARVVVAGVGALGSSVIQYLAAAGVGNIKAVDFDEVKLENLQSQVIHTSRDINRPKVASAKDKVKNINKNILFEAENLKLDAENILQVIDGYDLVIDCTDNYKARYLINDACEISGISFWFPVFTCRSSTSGFRLLRSTVFPEDKRSHTKTVPPRITRVSNRTATVPAEIFRFSGFRMALYLTCTQRRSRSPCCAALSYWLMITASTTDRSITPATASAPIRTNCFFLSALLLVVIRFHLRLHDQCCFSCGGWFRPFCFRPV